MPDPLAGGERRTLASGLRVHLLPDASAPLVTTALAYRVGAADEEPRLAGIAHFLEHMMFRGSPRFAAGEVDRLTRRAGGECNAFTGQDLTLYYFSLASDRWTVALELEADRMGGLTLDREQVEAERGVILEELAAARDDPWDSLGQAVWASWFGDHPYARPVLGGEASLAAIGRSELAAFHGDRYRAGGAALVVAGDVDDQAWPAIEAAFEGVAPGAPPRPLRPPAPARGGGRRLELRRGGIGRLIVALPAPPAAHPDQGPLRLLVALLAGGRSSRLERRLVEEEQLCAWIACDQEEMLDGGLLEVAAEVVPGVDPRRVEAAVVEELSRLATRGPSSEEVATGRRLLVAEALFRSERIEQRAVDVARAAALGDPALPHRWLTDALEASRQGLAEVASRRLHPSGSLVALSSAEAG